MFDQQSLRSACAYAQSDQSLCKSLEYSMTAKLLMELHLEFLSLKGGCTNSSESTLVKMPHCWKSHVAHGVDTHLKCLIETLPISITTNLFKKTKEKRFLVKKKSVSFQAINAKKK